MTIDLRADIREAGVDGKGLEGHAACHDDACPDARTHLINGDGIRLAMHPVQRRCSSLKYCPVCSVVALCWPGASPPRCSPPFMRWVLVSRNRCSQ